MATKWTRDQASVIDHRGSNLLVAAAAGSGKTAVLIERIIRLVTDKDKPIDIDKLLVVTFTNAAANEMKERVGLALEEALEKDPDSDHLQRQMLLLNRADITTINSFCGRLVRDNFHATDLDPNVRIGDPVEVEMIKKDLIEDLFEDLYDEKNEGFLRLVDIYSARNDDKPLMDMVLMLNNFVDSSAYPDLWLDEAAERFNTKDKDDKEIFESYLGPILFHEVKLLASSVYRLEQVIDRLDGYEDLVEYRDFLMNHCAYIRPILDCFTSDSISKDGIHNLTSESDNKTEGDLESGLTDLDLVKLKEVIDLYRTGQAKIKNFRISSKADDYVKEDYKKIKEVAGEALKTINMSLGKLYISMDDVRVELDLAYPYMRALSDLTKTFRQAYRIKKKALGLIDFADTEHTALDILTEMSNGQVGPSKIGLAYRDLYEEVFIDEYQDSNMVQELILSTISRDKPGNRFMVGDVKQSIYRFRQAMPEIFMKKYMSYRISQGPVDDGRKILLYNNFRSRSQVLEACNHVFMSIMRQDTGELDYTEEERLNPSAIFKEVTVESYNLAGPVEVRLVDKKYKDEDMDLEPVEEEEFRTVSAFRSQCQAMGAYIYDIVNNKDKPYLIFDKKIDKYRQLDYRDIVVLVRSPRSKLDDIEDVFGQFAIPLYSDLGGDYFSTIEVSIFENLLRIIDNPRQDICLLSVMRSPIYGFEPRDFALLRLLDKDLDIYGLLDKLYSMDKENLVDLGEDYQDLRTRVISFMDQLEDYRKKSILMPLDEFIWYLLKATGYYAYVGGLEMGQHRQNNLMLFFERARKFEKSSFKGLFNFVNYLDRVKTRGADFGEAKEVSEDANVVRLMSIHKSKGLEFPVVIVANADGKFNFRSSDYRLSLHQDLGYGPEIIDKTRRIRFPSLAKKYIDQKKRLEQLAEEMRLLYVAMTRAKEKLIFFASVDDYDNKLDAWKSVIKNQDGDIDSLEILKSSNYLDWIMMSIANLEVRGKALDASGHECDYVGYKDCQWIVNLEDKLSAFKKLKNFEARDEVPEVIYDKAEADRKEPDKEKSDLDADIENKKVKTSGHEEAGNKLVIKPYAYQASALKPASISVSEVKKILEADDQDMHESMYMKRQIPDLKTPAFMHTSKKKISYSSAEKGTIFHLVMELLDFQGLAKISHNVEAVENKLEADLEALVAKNILRQEELDTVNRKWIRDFVKTSIFARMSQADSLGLLHRETAIDYNIGVAQIYRDEGIDESERMMLVGIVDAFFEDQDGDLVLLDYKTDYVNQDNYDQVVARYRPQLDLYARALEDISGKKVKEKHIYLFSRGDLVSY